MTTIDPIMARIGAVVERGRAGETGPARALLTELWEEIGPDGDPFHRCTLAHYLADLQETTEEELRWDRAALAAAETLTDDRVRAHHATLQVRAFLPSLHLNLADDYQRLGRRDAARHHLRLAESVVDVLPADEYGATIRAALTRVAERLADQPTNEVAR